MIDPTNVEPGSRVEPATENKGATGRCSGAPGSAARCPKCNGVGYYVRTRYFDTEEADVWECQSPLCVWHGLLWHTSRPRACSNCGAPATARIVEQSEECDYGLVCDWCKNHPAVRRWIPLRQPNAPDERSGGQ